MNEVRKTIAVARKLRRSETEAERKLCSICEIVSFTILSSGVRFLFAVSARIFSATRQNLSSNSMAASIRHRKPATRKELRFYKMRVIS